MKKLFYKNKSGFTLIELLITLIVISFLATFALISYNSTRAKSRDASRESDVKGMRSAVELFISDRSTLGEAVMPRTTSWNDFLQDISPYFKSAMSYYNPLFPFVYCNDIDDSKLYMIGTLLEVSDKFSNTIKGAQLGYACDECVFSSGTCSEPPDCTDDGGGKVIYDGTAFCLGYENPND